MSLCAKWPAFDYQQRNGFHYLRLRSDQFVRVKLEINGQRVGSDIVIVPTDDERIKVLTIPLDVLPRGETLSLAEQVQQVLKQCKLVEAPTREVWLPAFSKVLAESANSLLDGARVSADKQVCSVTEVASVDLAKARPCAYGLKLQDIALDNYYLDQPFVFGISFSYFSSLRLPARRRHRLAPRLRRHGRPPGLAQTPLNT